MARRPEILHHLKSFGLNVIEVDGWQTRGSTIFNPKGSVNHHTAGPPRGNHPSLGILINGRHDVPGPLCNVSLARNNDVYLIAAGRANHAGAGGWKGLRGNSSVWGLEVEHTGVLATEPTPSIETWDIMTRIHAAFARVSGFKSDMVCQHFEWTTRKIDFIGANGNVFRAGTQYHINAPLPGQEIEDGEMKLWIVRGPKGDVYVFNGETLRPANNAMYRDIMRFHGAAGDPWFNWGQDQINAVPKVS